jgi:peroxiredoxin Q/BCP
MPILTQGDQAPDFKLQDENESWHRLSDYFGKYVVLYFYPKDDTSGCTKEACAFRDDFSNLTNRGVTVLGVSPDPPNSHSRFKEKYQLPFTLLADFDHKISDLYGAWGRKKFMGREYDGILRKTFLIDPDGRILHIIDNTKPANHSGEILQFLNKIG